ncbi:hypothetical protein [Spirosoma sp. 209]|uniref:hypothetical protein n=1 Tax=Spirosoma sp. 209 TaxID=1955701 RepID=UPI0011170494|nr:hypothetical protein [Spirosoma sp. 209]
MLSIVGLIFNTVGSVILAIALNQTTKMLNISITALEHFKDTFLSGGDVVSFGGLDKHRKSTLKNAKWLTNIGLILLVVGFILQLISPLFE